MGLDFSFNVPKLKTKGKNLLVAWVRFILFKATQPQSTCIFVGSVRLGLMGCVPHSTCTL